MTIKIIKSNKVLHKFYEQYIVMCTRYYMYI